MVENKPNALIYPYSYETVCVLRHSDLINYNIKVAVVPGKFFSNKLHLFCEDNFLKDDILISNDYIMSLDLCDTVIWLPYNYEDREYFFDVVKNNIMHAITEKKCCMS